MSLRSALDHLTTFLTVLVWRTAKNLPSPIGPGFESRHGQQKGDRSITLLQFATDRADHQPNVTKIFRVDEKNVIFNVYYLPPSSFYNVLHFLVSILYSCHCAQ